MCDNHPAGVYRTQCASVSHLPKLTHRVPSNQLLGFYQLFKSSGTAVGANDTERVWAYATGFDAPQYMAGPPSRAPLSRAPAFHATGVSDAALHPAYPQPFLDARYAGWGSR